MYIRIQRGSILLITLRVLKLIESKGIKGVRHKVKIPGTNSMKNVGTKSSGSSYTGKTHREPKFSRVLRGWKFRLASVPMERIYRSVSSFHPSLCRRPSEGIQCSYALPVYMEIRYRVSLHEFECYERQ